MRRSRIPRHVAPFGADRLVMAVEPDEPPGTWSSQARLMEPPPSVSLPERSPIGSFARQATHAGSPRTPARSRRRSSGLVQGRDLPERCGKWESARQRFARRAAAGIWERVLASLTADPARARPRHGPQPDRAPLRQARALPAHRHRRERRARPTAALPLAFNQPAGVVIRIGGRSIQPKYLVRIPGDVSVDGTSIGVRHAPDPPGTG